MHAYACIRLHMHADACRCMRMHTYACICMHMHSYARTFMHVPRSEMINIGNDAKNISFESGPRGGRDSRSDAGPDRGGPNIFYKQESESKTQKAELTSLVTPDVQSAVVGTYIYIHLYKGKALSHAQASPDHV